MKMRLGFKDRYFQSIKLFTSDGCSGGLSWLWETITTTQIPWHGACVKHDMEYWIGGTSEDRKKADIQLMIDVIENGYPIIAFVMYVGVRLGGWTHFPTRFRWGFGYPYFCKGKYGQRTNRENMFLDEAKKDLKGEVNYMKEKHYGHKEEKVDK